MKNKSKTGLTLFIKTRSDFKKAYSTLKNSSVIQLDTEYDGDGIHAGKIWSVQFGNGSFSCLVPVHYWHKLYELEQLLTDGSKTIVAHNLKAEYQSLWAIGSDITHNNVFDTMLAEKILFCGYHDSRSDIKLASVVRKRLGIEMSKEERKDFYNGVFEGLVDKFALWNSKGNSNQLSSLWSLSLLNYSITDVLHLQQIMVQQQAELIERDLDITAALEFQVIRQTAKMEYLGIFAPADGLMEYQQEMKEKSEIARKELTEALEVHWQAVWRKEYAKNSRIYDKWYNEHREIISSTNGDRDVVNTRKLSERAMGIRENHTALKPFPTRPKEKGELNLNSPIQVRKALSHAGIVLSSLAKELVEDLAGTHPLLDDLLEYKKYVKLAQMSEIYEKINPVTGRIHSTWNQIVDTGRYSSRKPNMQQIPSRTDEGKRFRNLFVAPKGRKLIVADYSAIELAIAGVLSKDKTLLSAINKNLDLHCFSMSRALETDYDSIVRAKKAGDESGLSLMSDKRFLKEARERFESDFSFPDLVIVKDIAKWIKKLRNDYFKHMTYASTYGISPYALSRKWHCSFEVAEAFLKLFFSIYPTLKSFMTEMEELGVQNQYSRSAIGRIRWYRLPRKPSREDVEERVLDQLDKEDRNIESVTDSEWNQLIKQEGKIAYKEYKQRMGGVRRKAANQPIQGTSADITKLSMVKLESLFVQAGFKFDESIILCVHDELLCEVENRHAKLASKLVAKAMVDAAHEVLGDTVRIEVEPVVTQFWSKD